MRAYYEQDTNVAKEIQSSFARLNKESERKILARIDKSKFIDGIDLTYMYQEMVWATDGYMRKAMIHEKIDPEQTLVEFDKLIELWKKVYLK